MELRNLKIIISAIIVLGTIKLSAQETKQIKELDYAGNKILVPSGCNAKSEYELLNCKKTDIQWLYLNDEMLKTVPKQFLNQFASQSFVKSHNSIKLKSFNSELVGEKFKLESDGNVSYKIIVSGIVNNQPLLLNIGTDNDLLKNSDLNELLVKMISLE